MKCIICDQRKGKRFCPAKGTKICAPCCGEKRVVEIRCPADCVYLASGQGYQRRKNYFAQFDRLTNPQQRQLMIDGIFKHGWLIDRLEQRIAGYAASLTSLKDEHVLEALGNVREAYRIEAKGLIFKPTAPNPLVESLSAEIRESCEKARDEEGADVRHLSVESLLEAIRFIELNVQFHIQEGGDDRYLKFVRQSHPDEGRTSNEGRILIQP